MDSPLRRALLSVSDKTGIVEIARALAARDVELLSTGGTAKLLREVEEPLFRAVLDYSSGNQCRAAAILGINRGTLRKKLRQFGLSG